MREKLYRLLLAVMLIAAGMCAVTSCSPDDDIPDEPGKGPDVTLLWGTWVSGTEYYRFSDDGSGTTWDTSEVTEEDAQTFSWTLSGTTLTLNHDMTISGAKITKTYTVTKLTSAELEFKDSFGRFSFTKTR